MAATLKGQLGVKSSPLCPTSSKYTTQLLVLDHMTNHYKKLSKAKAAIDNAPPKSMQTSQKMRDRRRRKDIEKYGSRPSSSMSHRAVSREEDIYDETQWDEPEDEEERQVRDIMRTTLRVPLKATHPQDSVDATAGSKTDSRLGYTGRPQSATFRGAAQAVRGAGYLNRTRPMSSRSTTSLASNFSQTSRCSNPLKATYDGDILDKHAHVFSEPQKPFTPRTLKSNRESSLKKYKYYTPPKKTHVTYKDQEQTEVKSVNQEPPQARPRRRNKDVDLGATETLTETKLMEMSLRSHDPRHPGGDGNNVPRLDISVDKDHMNWLQEQATKAQIRARNGVGKTEGTDEGDTLGQTDQLGQTDALRFTRTSASAKAFGVISPTSRRLGQAEEEQKYVEFAHEVTQDIVSRGICSDSVLNKVFENHIERKKGQLDERRLRAITTDIRRELGVDHVQFPKARAHLDDEDHHLDLEHTDYTNMNGTSEVFNGDSTGFDSTMMSQTNNTYNFDRTTDVFSTIHSQAEVEDLSATQALQQYQMDLTVKDTASERESAVDNELELGVVSALKEAAGSQGEPVASSSAVNGEAGAESAQESAAEAQFTEDSHTRSPAARPRARRLARQNASTAGHQNTSATEASSDAASAANSDATLVNDVASDVNGSPQRVRQESRPTTDTEARSEEDYEDEQYESDYDADGDDDGQEVGTHRTSDDDF